MRRLFWRSGSLLTLPDLFYRNIILGSQVLLSVPIVIVTWTHAEARDFHSTWSIGLVALSLLFLTCIGPRDGEAALPSGRQRRLPRSGRSPAIPPC